MKRAPHEHPASIPTPAGDIRIWARSPAEADELRRRVRAFVAGGQDGFDDVSTPEGTPFQRACWEACRRIPRGETRTYAWLAEMAGSPGAVRAAGQAMRRNPLPVVVPCHRVVAAGGIGGYAGESGAASGMLRIKRFLLALEGSAAGVPSVSRSRPPGTGPHELETHET